MWTTHSMNNCNILENRTQMAKGCIVPSSGDLYEDNSDPELDRHHASQYLHQVLRNFALEF